MVDLARELSGRVNEAYAVLGDDLRRAEYIVRPTPTRFFLVILSFIDKVLD